MTTRTKPRPRPTTARAGGSARDVAERPTTSDAEQGYGSTLRAARESAGLSVVELARRVAPPLGLSVEAMRVAIADYEAGRKTPGTARRRAFEAALGLSPERACTATLLSRVADLIDRYGPEVVVDSLVAVAGLVPDQLPPRASRSSSRSVTSCSVDRRE